MRTAETLLNMIQERGKRGVPLDDVYRQLSHPDMYLRAYARLQSNAGAMTQEVTEETVDGMSQEKMAQIIEAIRYERWQWTPVRRGAIPKSHGKTRPLGMPTMKDRAIQAWYLLALDPIAATTADPNSYGFRKERSCADAMEQCATVLSNSTRPQWRLEGDITSCFDTSSPAGLLTPIPMDKAILSTWLQTGYMDTSVLYETADGTPQGGILSPVLANRTLDGLETILLKQYPHAGVRALKGKKKQVKLVRYADDFVMTGLSKEVLEKAVKPLVVAFLHQRGLELSEEKTRITHIEDGCDFLGHNACKYHGQFLTRPSKTNVKTLLASIRKVIKDNKQATAYGLIAILNPTIRG